MQAHGRPSYADKPLVGAGAHRPPGAMRGVSPACPRRSSCAADEAFETASKSCAASRADCRTSGSSRAASSSADCSAFVRRSMISWLVSIVLILLGTGVPGKFRTMTRKRRIETAHEPVLAGHLRVRHGTVLKSGKHDLRSERQRCERPNVQHELPTLRLG